MKNDVRMVREITLEDAVDHFLPSAIVHPIALERHEQKRERLRRKIEEFCAGAGSGKMWLYQSSQWNPDALIGTEGVACQGSNGSPKLLAVVDY